MTYKSLENKIRGVILEAAMPKSPMGDYDPILKHHGFADPKPDNQYGVTKCAHPNGMSFVMHKNKTCSLYTPKDKTIRMFNSPEELTKHLTATNVPKAIKEEVISEEVEHLDEATKGNYHVSANYIKGYNANAEHAVKHYSIQKPDVADTYMGPAAKKAVTELPAHKEMLSQGFRLHPDNSIHASSDPKVARDSANEVHAHNTALSSIMAKKYPTTSMYESTITRLITGKKTVSLIEEKLNSDIKQEVKNISKAPKIFSPNLKNMLHKDTIIKTKIIDEEIELEKNKQRSATVKKIKRDSKDKIVINPPLEKPDPDSTVC